MMTAAPELFGRGARHTFSFGDVKGDFSRLAKVILPSPALPPRGGKGELLFRSIRGGGFRLLLIFDDRPSDSPFVERVWRSHSERAGTFHSMAECRWEMVVARHEGKTSLIVRGPETKAT